ncbi:MAG: carboxypeptidase regulatory-like domain-containing protein [Rhodopirellula sp.]|nr:carboxypeptidase regulatory-like domain-containing protein [Rhodopirellula sp.]
MRPHTDSKSLVALFAASLLLSIAGCGGSETTVKLVLVKGLVNYNGKPLENAVVTFVPENGPVASGTTGADGRFLLTTGGRPGAAPGSHNVSVLAPNESADASTPKEMTPEDMAKIAGTPEMTKIVEASKSRIPEKYSRSKDSGLTATVSENESENDFLFDLKG